MKLQKTVKGIALGTSLAAFVTLGAPAVGEASSLLDHGSASQVGDKKKDDKKKDDKKKDEKKDGEKGEGEGSCGEGSCGEGACGGHEKKDEKKN